MGLTRAGMDLWAVQLVGRCGSSVVQKYVRDAAASPDAAIARSRVLSQNLAELSAQAAERMSREDLRDLAASEVAAALRRWTPSLTEAVREALLPDLVAQVNRHLDPAPSACLVQLFFVLVFFGRVRARGPRGRDSRST